MSVSTCAQSMGRVIVESVVAIKDCLLLIFTWSLFSPSGALPAGVG